MKKIICFLALMFLSLALLACDNEKVENKKLRPKVLMVTFFKGLLPIDKRHKQLNSTGKYNNFKHFCS